MSALKVPAIIACSIICLGLGVGIGTGGAIWLGLTTDNLRLWKGGDEANAANGERKGLMPGEEEAKRKGAGMGGMAGMGGGGGKGGGFGKPPSPKAQLNTLIAKLDVLTEKPLTVNFDDEQKKKVQEHLDGLGTLEELTEVDAKKRLDGLLEVLKDQKQPLAAAGFPWPGEKGGDPGFAKNAPNPFKEDAGAKHLKSLEKRLAKPAS